MESVGVFVTSDERFTLGLVEIELLGRLSKQANCIFVSWPYSLSSPKHRYYSADNSQATPSSYNAPPPAVVNVVAIKENTPAVR